MRCEVTGAGVACIFFSKWGGAPLGVGALRILHTLYVGSGTVAYTSQSQTWWLPGFLNATVRSAQLFSCQTLIWEIQSHI